MYASRVACGVLCVIRLFCNVCVRVRLVFIVCALPPPTAVRPFYDLCETRLVERDDDDISFVINFTHGCGVYFAHKSLLKSDSAGGLKLVQIHCTTHVYAFARFVCTIRCMRTPAHSRQCNAHRLYGFPPHQCCACCSLSPRRRETPNALALRVVMLCLRVQSTLESKHRTHAREFKLSTRYARRWRAQ